ncbi:hypothetical protein H632_c1313p1 [Helicosporidium sp. ATCC 50920]|nr:hypothetical protein H632_c1313p1 [Helicosporidium sp. ATCC 50920]|eukprot:KDD74440.1 hypothetical protein H632_c1313p1 [Helicosporidium sp. ATCC 50920]
MDVKARSYATISTWRATVCKFLGITKPGGGCACAEITAVLYSERGRPSLGFVDMSRPTDGQVMDSIKQQMAVAFLQSFYQTVRDKCFKMCVTKPSTSLGSSEQQCLARCCDRYADATNIVGQATLNANGIL